MTSGNALTRLSHMLLETSRSAWGWVVSAKSTYAVQRRVTAWPRARNRTASVVDAAGVVALVLVEVDLQDHRADRRAARCRGQDPRRAVGKAQVPLGAAAGGERRQARGAVGERQRTVNRTVDLDRTARVRVVRLRKIHLAATIIAPRRSGAVRRGRLQAGTVAGG